MRSNYIFGFLLLFSMLLLSCKEEIKTKYDNGTVKEKYFVIKNKDGKQIKNGIFCSFYENGKPFFKGIYKNDLLSGLSENWYENGTKKFEGTYQNGQLNGIVKNWYENGSLESESDFKQDKLNGKQINYYQNGKKQIECFYLDSLLDSTYISWLENGEKHIECRYKAGQMIGDYIFNSDISNLKVSVNSINEEADLSDGVSFISDLITPQISNASAFIDKKTGHLVIKFDYQSQAWPIRSGDYKFLDSRPFLIRLFDKYGNHIKHFDTYELYIPAELVSRLKSIGYKGNLGTPFDTPYKRPRVKDLNSIGNVLEYQLDAKTIDYAASLEIGFSCFNQIWPSNALRKPPYLSQTELAVFKDRFYYVFQ